MLPIHPDTRSAEPAGRLGKLYGVSTETICKWRKRGTDDGRDRSSRPHRLPWKANEECTVMCPPPGERHPTRRPHLHRHPHPAAPEPGCRVPHS